MTTGCTTARATANSVGDGACTASCTDVHLHGALIECARRIFPRKTWAFIADVTGLSERSAKYRMAGERTFTAEELGALLHSEHGLEFLAAMMAGSRAAWWRRFGQQMAISDARRMERAARRKLQEALDADRDVAAAIERADAFLVRDAHDDRPVAAAMWPVSGVPRRALAPKT